MDDMGKERVLVVEDDQRILRFIRVSLNAHGYDVLVAADGEEALAMAKAEQPDIMLLDIFLPVKGGLEVLRELRTFSNMPVIACSSNSSVLRQALDLGANDFMSKPFAPDEMIQRIRTILHSRRN